MNYGTGSIVMVAESIWIKNSAGIWGRYTRSGGSRLDDRDFGEFIGQFDPEEFEILRFVDPYQDLTDLPVGSVVTGGMFGAVALKSGTDQWSVGGCSGLLNVEEMLSMVSSDGTYTVVYRGGEG